MDANTQLQELAEYKQWMLNRCLQASSNARERIIFCGQAALALLNIEIPKELRNDAQPLQRVVTDRNHWYSMAHIVCCVRTIPIEIVKIRGGVWCTSAACTWVLYAHTASISELVILGENMMRRDKRRRVATIESLQAYIARVERYIHDQPHRKRNVRGLERCKRALRIMREHTDSSQETRLRLFMMKHGFGNPEVNWCIHNEHGSNVYYLDMAYPELKIAIEYDGRHHAEQWEKDNHRRKDIEDMGWIYLQVSYEDLRDIDMQSRLIDRIAHAVRNRTHGNFCPVPEMTDAQITDGRLSLRTRPWWEY